MVRLQNNPNPRARCTHAVSNDRNRVLELRRAVQGKLLYRTDGPSIHSVTEATVRILSRRILSSARTRSRRSRLDWGRVSKTNIYELIVGTYM